MFGGDEDNIANSRGSGGRIWATGDGHPGVNQGLSIDLPVHAGGKQLAERAYLDIGWRELYLGTVQSGTGNVIVKGQDVCREEEPVLQILEAEWEFA